MKYALILFALFLHHVSLAAPARPVDAFSCDSAYQNDVLVISELEKCLATGLRLEIHGVVPEQRLAVATFRSSKNFFVFEHLSLLGANPILREEIMKLNRHDSIIVKGEIANLKSPQKHIRATEFVVENKSKSSEDLDGYSYSVKIPDELLTQDRLVGLVHALHDGGRILVVEYKDVVLPVFVEPQFLPLTQNLYRNDVIEFYFQIQAKPGRPVHLNLFDPANGSAILQVKESALQMHGQNVKLKGELVMFPKSPQVQFNVFALRSDIGNGLTRYYTLVNFNDPNVFKAIRAKLQALWDQSEMTKVKDRNKWRNPNIIIEAEGTLNVQDANQANVQILLDNVDSVGLAK